MGKPGTLYKRGWLSAAEWGVLYGIASRLGATAIFPVKPKDAIAPFVSHLAFGVTKTTIAVNLGEERLFKPKNLTKEIDEPQYLLPKI